MTFIPQGRRKKKRRRCLSKNPKRNCYPFFYQSGFYYSRSSSLLSLFWSFFLFGWGGTIRFWIRRGIWCRDFIFFWSLLCSFFGVFLLVFLWVFFAIFLGDLFCVSSSLEGGEEGEEKLPKLEEESNNEFLVINIFFEVFFSFVFSEFFCLLLSEEKITKPMFS